MSLRTNRSRKGVNLTLACAFLGCVPTPALAQALGGGDVASFWIETLFGRSSSLGGADALSNLTEVLREILGAYGAAMFVIAGLMLMWQLVSMIAETAQTGVFMGRRANQLWTPLRFVVGIALLIPLGGGLGFGQRMIVKLAEEGSSVASEAWQGAMGLVGEQFLMPLRPQFPDMERLVAASIEVELCRGVYQEVYQSYLSADVPVDVASSAGPMQDFVKSPAFKLRDETWLYTNDIFAGESLCGGYSFLTPAARPDPALQGIEDKYAALAAASSRAVAERLSYQGRSMMEPIAAAFLLSRTKDSSLPDARASLLALAKEQAQALEINHKQILADAEKKKGSGALQSVSDRGWLMAGVFPFAVTRQQIVMGEVLSQAFPKIRTPLLGHDVLTRAVWRQKAEEHFGFRFPTGSSFVRYDHMYDQMTEAMKRVRHWLYGEQASQGAVILPDQQDLKDAIGPFDDVETAQTVLARLLTAGAVSYGVLARAPEAGITAGQHSASGAVLPDRAYLSQPLQTIAEMGRRYHGYGAWLMGMLSPVLAEPATTGTALSFAMIAISFWLAGLCLLFVVPFIPLFRFMAAALSWALSVLGAVLSLPIVALAHLHPAGEGLAGPLARRAYWLWLGLFIRPSLILFGYVGGLALFLLGLTFLNLLIFDWLSSVASPQSQVFWILRTGLALFYALAVLVLSNVSFRGISAFPDLLLKWVDTKNPLPETLSGAQGRDGQADRPFYLSPSMERGVDSAVNVISRLTDREKITHGSSRNVTTTQTTAARQAQSAHFPNLREDKADIVAQTSTHTSAPPPSARASAHAKAEASSSGARAQAGAYASTGDNKTVAISRQMMPLDGDLQKQKSAQPESAARKALEDQKPKETAPASEKPADKD